MFSEEKYENILFFVILPPHLLAIRIHRLQIMFKIPMVLILRVNLGIILPFPVDYLYLQINL